MVEPDQFCSLAAPDSGALPHRIDMPVGRAQRAFPSRDDAERVVVGGDRYLVALDPREGREVRRHEHGGRGSTRTSSTLRARGFDVEGREWPEGSAVPFWSARTLHAIRTLLQES